MRKAPITAPCFRSPMVLLSLILASSRSGLFLIRFLHRPCNKSGASLVVGASSARLRFLSVLRDIIAMRACWIWLFSVLCASWSAVILDRTAGGSSSAAAGARVLVGSVAALPGADCRGCQEGSDRSIGSSSLLSMVGTPSARFQIPNALSSFPPG
jgi:hypothetical protein